MGKGHDVNGMGYLVLQVLPMGWKSAVGIMQAVHRRLMSSSLRHSAKLPNFDEIRKTGVMPSSVSQATKGGWQVYLDNYASFGVHSKAEAERLQGQLSEYHRRAKEAWTAWNIPSSADKSLLQNYQAKELGCQCEGQIGLLTTTTQRKLDGCALTFYLGSVYNPHRMWLALLCGRFNFILQFRRPASCALHKSWQVIAGWQNCKHLGLDVCRELLLLCCLMPTVVTKLRAKPDLLGYVLGRVLHGGRGGSSGGPVRVRGPIGARSPGSPARRRTGRLRLCVAFRRHRSGTQGDGSSRDSPGPPHFG